MEDTAVMVVNIITPDGQVYSHHGKRVVARATDGDLGILANHLPIIATLKIAEVRVLRADNDNHEDAIAVNGGYLEFKDNVLNIVADSAERARNIDLRRARYAKERAEEEIKHAKTVQDIDEVQRAQVALARAINRIQVYNHR
ncbi:F0F1 ATP synthase subunit epsilon [Bombilactobacillus folatiphilus]|uniref:ATP synthase epsilon chain n=1 Tax=Bombilactobacillus folatiphilus TaxID=2923362 RepID=A0ABY4PBN9_9LACO|nr:F0F1 ATP synthase subunit epsilon [Bombilactobacillus folatiphilus]UQS82677.1 F0F1 ATP synthase subunit epsilon [Bombilactobacillus folatiphilus]